MIRFPLRNATLIAATLVGFAGAAHAADPVLRTPAGKFPIASAVEVPPGYATIYLSGLGADVADKAAKPMTLEAYGNTETQTRSALTKLQAELAKMKLGFGDVVQMHIFMAADPKLGKIDFPGMMKAYTEFFGTKAQPNLPSRAAFQVAALANPGWLVEIELVAVRPPAN
ncbi:endoribonuclease L-PSP [Ameyamaea chiangmaiensis NBRC 103196]|uniref:Uncharacterized protein n=1 Tax=Ameyamaea chiangmaiensis TaxID=442969 RepID=A0A850PAR8_9PROT|nr:RidA family protein [Ameyamaea chiangmaiensis]MBS4074028.1 RidA family protein [Ameyamaea chiangmaiensis]NVN39416.1 hypothetical protein [Ameyamaea chiangmaiensis]GBQ67523.1 endoribonuclease L-PSP [Ameyamaea chiangmaiensis NBRC 103196]